MRAVRTWRAWASVQPWGLARARALSRAAAMCLSEAGVVRRACDVDPPHDVARLVQHAERAVRERGSEDTALAALDVVRADGDRSHAQQLAAERVDAQRSVVAAGHVRAGRVEGDVLR